VLEKEEIKLKLVAPLHHEKEIDFLKSLGVSVLMINSDCLTTRSSHFFSQSQIVTLIKKIHETNLELYVNLNTFLHESDLIIAESYLAFLKSIDIDGIIIFDWTYYTLAKPLGLESKLIYQPGTLTTNLYDPWFYTSFNIKGITLAREITLDSINIIAQNNVNEIELSIIGHGVIPMFYSRRPLIDNYLQTKKLNSIKYLSETDLYIAESTREGVKYPIFEDRFGTHLFRNRYLESFNEIQLFGTFLSDFFLERFMMDDDEFFASIKAYQNHKLIDEFMKNYGHKYDKGFYYKSTSLKLEVKR
jgi:putative protease